MTKRHIRLCLVTSVSLFTLCVSVAVGAPNTQTNADGTQAEAWVERFRFTPPPHAAQRVGVTMGELPTFRVEPARHGRQLVRVSLPFPEGSFPSGAKLTVRSGATELAPDVHVLTFHPVFPRCVRRAIVTFPWEFPDEEEVEFELSLQVPEAPSDETLETTLEDLPEELKISIGEISLSIRRDRLMLSSAGLSLWNCMTIAPAPTADTKAKLEWIERGQYYNWFRIFLYDDAWPRILEIRADALGTVAAIVHLQNRTPSENIVVMAPRFGWDIRSAHPASLEGSLSKTGSSQNKHSFEDGQPVQIKAKDRVLSFPAAPYTRRGSLSLARYPTASIAEYYRCGEEETVPHQSSAWRQAGLVISPTDQAPWNRFYQPPHRVSIQPEYFDALYAMGERADLAAWPVLDALEKVHRNAIVQSATVGDDAGNVTAYSDTGKASLYGMNRLNHCPAIFEDAYRKSDARLLETAIQWCNSFYDLSIWWGEDETFGGTRYNSAKAAGKTVEDATTGFMWRTNFASNFCTKGYDSFFYAYEETGDPRMAVALRSQLAYAREFVHTDRGECRNIGDVLDFHRLARFTGDPSLRNEAMRLFRQLRTKLSDGDLFSQGGKPIVPAPPFMNDDQIGYKHPFAKPYIIGYGLAGLPALAADEPDEPKLAEVVRAVADFQAESQDPLGGWRYPHPNSTNIILSQSLEHAAQLCRAIAFLEGQNQPVDNLLDAVERMLRSRVLVWRKTGRILSGLQGWEFATGKAKNNDDIHALYATPEERDASKDYSEGAIGLGSAPPEGLVYFSKVLDFYLERRPAERLFHAGPELETVLGRVEDRRIRLIPEESGSFLRMERPESSSIGFTLWAPEWVTFPKLGYGPDELGGMELDWHKDEKTGAVSYVIDRPETKFSALFIPSIDTVDCYYTVQPKSEADLPSHWGTGPCLQLKSGDFEGDDAELMTRIHYRSNGEWIALSDVAGGNSRNVQYIKGHASPEMTGGMKESGWRTIQTARPDSPLIAAISRDGNWLAATAAEHSTSIYNNANASHRCLHSQGSMPLRKEGPSTLRVRVYLFKGTLDELQQRYRNDVANWAASPPVPMRNDSDVIRYGMSKRLPRLREPRGGELDFPLAYDPQGELSFDTWRERARAKYLESLLTPPTNAPFEPALVATEDRGTYTARKIVFNISAYERVPAYILTPKGEGPFPAIVALHGHGAHFSIGKEKVIRPFGESAERVEDAQAWVEQCYGGRFIGDELAKRGYVVFSMDALFWGDRGRQEGVEYTAQQLLAANMLQLGLSWAGTIVWNDIRSAEFVAGLPEVDPARIGAVGLSMGSNRTWHLCAATDRVKIGAAICWMGTTAVLTAPGNNQTTGQSAFSMTHPGLRNRLDYPDVASIACPKPMLFFQGDRDPLFPIPGVEAAFEKMRTVWSSQAVEDRLNAKIWPVPHVFNRAMQDEAFAWFDGYLQPRP